ncbi:hypothetical protein BDV25DRAFT_164978 [Aspergillus avenaceus]|uniref:Uncharacterized protein n=1 Tax=Aspergillus avenaceus TaxID=36643 RepID=A0A5N6TG55_ASPAV|nr:hypothetical protein BDV25DRAFT_164978 [Aspergillus avenaceus]
MRHSGNLGLLSLAQPRSSEWIILQFVLFPSGRQHPELHRLDWSRSGWAYSSWRLTEYE